MPSLHAQVLILAAIASSAALAVAEDVDLTKVDRSIRKEPLWASGKPQYCLFVILKGDAWGSVSVSESGERQADVFTVSAERRIWFVVDGDDLYMDINENGDLTDPGEKLPLMEVSDEQRERFTVYSHWRIPDIKGTDGKPLITNIKINPKTFSGAAFGAKSVRFAGPFYYETSMNPTFSDTPAEAPILHVTGPRRLSLRARGYKQEDNRNVLRSVRVEAHTYVDGLGPGTRFVVGSLDLDCRVEFPMADGRSGVKEFRLRHYNTGDHQTGSAKLPEGVDEQGTVKITLFRRPEATGPAVEPAEVELPVTQQRVVREEEPPAVDQ